MMSMFKDGPDNPNRADCWFTPDCRAGDEPVPLKVLCRASPHKVGLQQVSCRCFPMFCHFTLWEASTNEGNGLAIHSTLHTSQLWGVNFNRNPGPAIRVGDPHQHLWPFATPGPLVGHLVLQRGPSVRWNVLSVGDSASWQQLRQSQWES